MLSVVERISRVAAETPHAVAYLQAGQTFSYRYLDQLVDRAAQWLIKNNVGEDDIVGLSLPDPFIQLGFSIALLRIGVPCTLFGAMQTEQQFVEQCKATGATTYLSHVHSESPARFLKFDQQLFRELWHGPQPAQHRAVLDPDRLALLTMGSGTSGDPKVIPISHENLNYRMLNRQSDLDIGGANRTLIMQNFSSQSFLMRALAVFSSGGTVVANPVPTGFSAAECHKIFEAVDAFGVDYMHCTAYHAQVLVDNSNSSVPRLPNLKLLSVGASTVSQKLRRELRARITPNICINYGANETGSIARAMPDDLARHPDCVGRLSPVSEVEILDNDNKPVPLGDKGIIHVRGPSIIKGYFRNEEATNSSFRDGWFNTRDIGHLTADGHLHCQGRNDDMMIVAGFNVHPTEIERVLDNHPAVAESAVIGVPAKYLQTVPVAFVVMSSRECGEEELLDFAEAELGAKTPRSIFFCHSLPRNANGKIEKFKLRDMILDKVRGAEYSGHDPA